jgi:hypothetical protein
MYEDFVRITCREVENMNAIEKTRNDAWYSQQFNNTYADRNYSDNRMTMPIVSKCVKPLKTDNSFSFEYPIHKTVFLENTKGSC